MNVSPTQSRGRVKGGTPLQRPLGSPKKQNRAEDCSFRLSAFRAGSQDGKCELRLKKRQHCRRCRFFIRAIADEEHLILLVRIQRQQPQHRLGIDNLLMAADHHARVKAAGGLHHLRGKGAVQRLMIRKGNRFDNHEYSLLDSAFASPLVYHNMANNARIAHKKYIPVICPASVQQLPCGRLPPPAESAASGGASGG